MKHSICLPFKYNYTSILHLVSSNNDQLLSVADNEGNIIVYDLDKSKAIQQYNGKPRVTSMSFSKNDEMLAVSICDQPNNLIYIFKLFVIDQQPIKVIEGHKWKISGLIFTNEDQYLVSCSYDKSIRIWNVDTFSLIKVEHAYFQIENMAISEQLNLLAIVTSDGFAYLYSFKNCNFKLLSMWKADLNAMYVEFIPKHKLLVTLGSLSFKIWDLRNISLQKGAKLLREVRRKNNFSIHQIVVKNNSIFASISDDLFNYKKSIIMFNIRSQKMIFSISHCSYQSQFQVTQDFNTFFEVHGQILNVVGRDRNVILAPF